MRAGGSRLAGGHIGTLARADVRTKKDIASVALSRTNTVFYIRFIGGKQAAVLLALNMGGPYRAACGIVAAAGVRIGGLVLCIARVAPETSAASGGREAVGRVARVVPETSAASGGREAPRCHCPRRGA